MARPNWPTAPGCSTLLGALLLVCGACPALALERGQLEVGGGPMLARVLLPEGDGERGYGGQLHAACGVAGPWGLDLAGSWSLHDPAGAASPAFHLTGGSLALRFQVDDSPWEPYLVGGLGLYSGDLPEELVFGPGGLQLGLGVVVRQWGRLAPALELRYHAFFADLASYPHYFTLALRLDLLVRG